MNATKLTVFYHCQCCNIVFEQQVERDKPMSDVHWFEMLERSTVMHECHATSAMKLVGLGTFRGFRMQDELKA